MCSSDLTAVVSEHQRPRHHCGCLATPEPVDRRDADDATFRATLARLEAAPVADEDTVERVARAIHDSDPFCGGWPCYAADQYRDQARAAIAALKPAPGTDSSGQASCGDLSPSVNFGGDGESERFMCELPHGHGGAHQRDNGGGLPPMRWVVADSSGLAVQRVLAVDLPGYLSPYNGERAAGWNEGLRVADALIRAAVAGPQRDHGGEGGQ